MSGTVCREREGWAARAAKGLEGIWMSGTVCRERGRPRPHAGETPAVPCPAALSSPLGGAECAQDGGVGAFEEVAGFLRERAAEIAAYAGI